MNPGLSYKDFLQLCFDHRFMVFPFPTLGGSLCEFPTRFRAHLEAQFH